MKLNQDMTRFTIGKTLNQRQANLKLFCDRMPTVPCALVGQMMSHVATEDLSEHYQLLSKGAKNFTALWRWTYMPKK